MTKYLLLIVGLVMGLGCKKEESVIIIVDIGHLDRPGIAKQLSIINKCSPKVIGLDFLLTTDSLDKDVQLSIEISKTKNLVQTSTLHNFIEHTSYWDSLEVYHSKFLKGNLSFSNITITDDSIFVRELPMRQYYKDKVIPSFSYAVADNSFGVNPKYDENGDEDFLFERSSIGTYFKVISSTDLLKGNFNTKDLQDKIVLMGLVSDKGHSFFIDENRKKRISGVEIQACIIRQIIK